MSEYWLEVRLQVPVESVDLVSQALTEIGSSGLITEERRLDTFQAPDPEEAPADGYRVRAFFPSPADRSLLEEQIRAVLSPLGQLFPGLRDLPLEILPVDSADWAEEWKQHFGLTRIGRRLVIRPSWEEYEAAAGEAVVVLDPGMAFGTGTHGTTRLCLEVLAGLFEGRMPPRRVLDVGTGSGILAIAAAALGAERVFACDIEPDACRIARQNAALNRVAHLVEVAARPLELLEEGFQVVLANILAEELVRLGPQLVACLEPAGILVLSGILHEKEELVATGFAALGLQGPEVRRREEWSCLIYRKP